MSKNHLVSDRELRQLIVTIGRWFGGFGKFALMMNRSYDERLSGENNMIQQLAKESHKIDLYIKEQLEHYRREAIRDVQQRLVDSNRVSEAIVCTPDMFWSETLTDYERQILPGGYSKEKSYDLCLREPIEKLFKTPHSLSCLNENIAARMLKSAINDGVVTVIIGESVTPVVMDGLTARLDDAFSLAELVDTDVSFMVNIGGFEIEFGAGNE